MSIFIAQDNLKIINSETDNLNRIDKYGIENEMRCHKTLTEKQYLESLINNISYSLKRILDDNNIKNNKYFKE